jgi:uncharacterized protein YndB with AHSA1/START domain
MAINTDINTNQVTPDEESQEKTINITTINITRIFDLSHDKVWKAWTEPESFKKWWGPKDFTCPYCTMDLQEGGKYLNCMRSPQGDEFWTTGLYLEIIPYQKLVYSDSFSDDKGNIIPASDLKMPGDWPLELLVTVTFEEMGETTKMELQQVGIPPEIYDDCITGWQQSFDKLEENLK